MKKSRILRGATMTAMATVMATKMIGGAQAQETIDITLVTGFPPPATFVGAALDAYVPQVNKMLATTGNYKINWNLAHSGQIAKPRGELEAIETGLGELGIIPTPFHADKLPLHEIYFKTPFSTRDMDLLTRIAGQMEASFPDFQRMWDTTNQTPLAFTGAVDNYLVLSARPIKALNDFKGHKIGAAGPNLPWVTALGAAGVSTNLADAYNSLSTGIYESMIVWAQAAGAFKLCEPAPNLVDPQLGAVVTQPITVNNDFWESTPDEVRQALKAAGWNYHMENLKRVNEGASAGLERCRAEYGLKETKMPQSEREEWAALMPNFAKQWAERVEGEGYAGTAILNYYMDAIRAAGETPVRNWDQN